MINVDIKVTSITQMQSSCPFKSAHQKIYGLGYNLLVFVYKKIDNNETKKSRLNILHTVFVDKEQTADYQLTTSISSILDNKGNKDDLMSLFFDKNLPKSIIFWDSKRPIITEILNSVDLKKISYENYLHNQYSK
jgi:hypothetical protein